MIIDERELNTKAEIRAFMKKKRSSLTIQRILVYSSHIYETLAKMDEYKNADTILSYVSFSSEVDTRFLMNNAFKDGKKIAVPKVVSDTEMNFYYIDSLDELSEGAFNILEPTTDKMYTPSEDNKAIILLPGVAFDESLNRLGYGGGFYDRFLEKNPDIFKVMLAYELEKTPENLPTGEFDIKSDVVITEINVYR